MMARRKQPGRSILTALALLGALAQGLACAPATAQSETDRIREVLELAPGDIAADVGAGEGEWTLGLAEAVGPTGRVYATEVDLELIEELRELAVEKELETVTVVEGDQESTGLPESCCDAILLRMVYHHFTDPAAMRADLARALRPGGRLAVIDITPQTSWRDLPDVPERGGHGLTPDQLVAEMESDGWTAVRRIDDWSGDADRFCVVFREGE